MSKQRVAIVDGSATPNPGEMVVAIVIGTAEGDTFTPEHEVAKRIGRGTNNLAEMMAVYHAFDESTEPLDAIYSDSLFVVEGCQLTEAKNYKGPEQRKIAAEIKRMSKRNGTKIFYVPRERNIAHHIAHAESAKVKAEQVPAFLRKPSDVDVMKEDDNHEGE